MVVGGGAGLLVPAAHHLDGAIESVLGLLLFATVLGVPFAAVGRALRDGSFLAVVGVVNVVLVPLVVVGLSRFVAESPALLFGVLLVRSTPCIDDVIVRGSGGRRLRPAPHRC
ncbi:hypothetical protein [Rathayibacter tanaceti]|uniref:Sodium bile acid symporter family protein n=2 Tax=Rathayibacter tanaceti TaxID=1671680 RepID=A0ACD2XHJ8_9MICO|nr:hypothetical protein [Rathayibacter tanaceti]KZX21115.1 Sodium Bile acid symporter family protein [Rathayibacter tanaceti]TCO36182.1 sodium bile acid symporter family protein [Rathayibacter tanaceti]